MRTPHLTLRRLTGFTLIEIMVAVSILAIMASLVTVNFVRDQQNARDGRRRGDVHTYADALELYRLSHKSYFVEMPGQKCNASQVVKEIADLQTMRLTDGDCVGIDGRSYGLVTAREATVDDGEFGSSRTYAHRSIADALVAGGYLSGVVTDPSNKAVGSGSSPDYILVRCCVGGVQNPNQTGSLFAVWTKLEGNPSAAEQENTAHLCGGSKAAPADYRYDFGSGALPASTAFAAGNGAVQTSKAGSCEKDEVALVR